MLSWFFWGKDSYVYRLRIGSRAHLYHLRQWLNLTYLASRELLTIAIVNLIKSLDDLKGNACHRNQHFGCFDTADKQNAENIAPALPVLGISLGHGCKAID